MIRPASSRLCLPALCLAAGGLLAPAAAAMSAFLEHIPSRPDNCNTCHTNGGGTERNPFGEDVEASLNADGRPDWSALWNVDSDGDGQSNGQELGDPCGEWEQGLGDAPRTVDLSFPGDETDTTAADADDGCSGDNAPPEAFDDRPSEGAGAGGGDEDGLPFGCFGNQVESAAAPATFSAFALVALALRRRRRS